jgi:hypothetical protein
MKNLPLIAPLVIAIFSVAAYAQDPPKPAAEAQKPPAEAAKSEPAPARRPGQEPDPKILEGLFACIAEGLPEGWKKTWFVIRQTAESADRLERSFAADFFYATNVNDRKGRPLQPCGPDRILEGVGALNDYLPENQQRWTGATFSFMRDGKFQAQYDYTPPKPTPIKPAAKKPAAKKPAAS